MFFIVGETNVCNYVDDTGLHACDKDVMIYKTPGAIEWFETNYMKLNKDKCKVLIAGHKLEWMWLDVGNTSLMQIEHAYSGWHPYVPVEAGNFLVEDISIKHCSTKNLRVLFSHNV